MKRSWLVRGVAAVLGCAVAMSAAACGNSGGGDDTVVFYHYAMTTTLNAQLEQKLAEFTEETGIKVKHVSVSKDNFNATISTKVGGRKKDIDVLYLDQPLLAQYADSNLLYKLDDYITESDSDAETVDGTTDGSFLFNKNAFSESAWKTAVYKGSTYAIPLTMNTSVFYYNTATVKTALGLSSDAAAVEAVESIETWDDLKAFASRVDGLGTDYALFGGMSNGGYMGWYSQVFVAAAGGTMYDEASGTVLPDNDGSVTRAFEMIKYLYDNSPESIYNSNTGFKGTASAPAGKVLFNLADSSAIKDLNVSYTTFGAIPIPGESKEIGSKSNIGGENLVITQKSDKKEQSLKLIKYLVSENCAAMFQQCTNNFSAVDKYATVETFSTDTNSSVYKMYNVVKSSLENAQVRPVVAGWLMVNDNGIPTHLKKYIDGGDDGYTEVSQALDAIRAYAATQLK